jgi:hypothetical protein
MIELCGMRAKRNCGTYEAGCSRMSSRLYIILCGQVMVVNRHGPTGFIAESVLIASLLSLRVSPVSHVVGERRLQSAVGPLASLGKMPRFAFVRKAVVPSRCLRN